MPTIHILCGNTGAGKTTYAHKLAAKKSAVRFSIDPWMDIHYGADYAGQGLDWMLPRTERCKKQIWEVITQLIPLGIDVVLDLGFGSRASRDECREKAKALGAATQLHFLDVPREIRLERVMRRNRERDPKVFALEVTEEMFGYVEPMFEPPTVEEIQQGKA